MVPRWPAAMQHLLGTRFRLCIQKLCGVTRKKLHQLIVHTILQNAEAAEESSEPHQPSD